MDSKKRNAILEKLRMEFPPGTRVRLDKFSDPYSTLKPGEFGYVSAVDDIATIHVKWDSGSTLGVAYGVDEVSKVTAIYLGETVMVHKGLNAGNVGKVTHITPDDAYPIHVTFPNGEVNCYYESSLYFIKDSLNTPSLVIGSFESSLQAYRAEFPDLDYQMVSDEECHLCYLEAKDGDRLLAVTESCPLAYWKKEDALAFAKKHNLSLRTIK